MEATHPDSDVMTRFDQSQCTNPLMLPDLLFNAVLEQTGAPREGHETDIQNLKLNC